MSKLTKALTAAAGNAGGGALYAEDVFSTYLYTGTATTNNIVNGVDLTEGGLVWFKTRDDVGDHNLVDSERGINKGLESNTTDAEIGSAGVTAFNSDGFTVDFGFGKTNSTSSTYASWTFRKAEKFFDVVTYTGDGQTFRNLSHSLNADIGAIVVKRTDSTSDWYVLSRNSDATNGVRFTKLNSTAAGAYDGSNHSVYWTTTTFRPALVDSAATNTNISGATYVAYLFASDAGGFGDDGSESIIKCGSYTGNGGAFDLNLGFEPQWFLSKCTSTTGNWNITDNMRGFASPASTTIANKILQGNTNSAEQSDGLINPTATGMATTYGNLFNESGKTYIYIAIRRPMKTPESGAEVFAAASSNTNTLVTTAFDVDAALSNILTGANHYFSSRLTAKSLLTDTTSAEQGPYDSYDYSKGYQQAISDPTFTYLFKRATGFFDVVAYTGTGVTNRKISHNLTVAPEIVIVKNRNTPQNWYDYHSGDPTGYTQLNTSNASQTDGKYYFGDDVNIIAPTSTVFTVGGANAGVAVNGSAETYIAYLFATLDGVSKVGSYTGTVSNVDVDCGFSAGARFILIKRTDSTGDWYVWDSVRGIVAGNDPYLLLNTTAAEVTSTDYIDPLSSGFTVTSSAPAALNASGGTYIFLAIA
jgi:hypothetical protein